MGVARSLGKRLDTTPRNVKQTTRKKGRRGMNRNSKLMQQRIKRVIWRSKRGRYAKRLADDWF
jgi:hypothetical protein